MITTNNADAFFASESKMSHFEAPESAWDDLDVTTDFERPLAINASKVSDLFLTEESELSGVEFVH